MANGGMVDETRNHCTAHRIRTRAVQVGHGRTSGVMVLARRLAAPLVARDGCAMPPPPHQKKAGASHHQMLQESLRNPDLAGKKLLSGTPVPPSRRGGGGAEKKVLAG